jgi:lysozyme
MKRSTRLTGTVAASAIVLVGAFEGLRLAAYRDPIGIPTICYGATRGVQMGDRATKAECEALLVEELEIHEKGMRACLKAPDALTDGQYVAFLSFTYNVGVGAFCGSTARRMINDGNVKGACAQLSRWDKARGIRLPGLTKRRTEERRICENGI